MKPEKVFKRYDIRGKVPEEIDEEFAERLGQAFGTFLRNNKTAERAVVCQDNKETSNQLKQKLIQGIKSTGIDVIDIGTGPTDFLALNGNYREAPGIQVTSSHLPVENNGFKLLYAKGNGFLNKDLYQVQDIFRDGEFAEGKGDHQRISEEAEELYVEKTINFLEDNDLEIERELVVDSMGGTSQKFLKNILDRLNADYKMVENNELRDPPNPKPENLGKLDQKVSGDGIGFANDLDADRVTVHYGGRWLTGDEVFGVLSQVFEGACVASVDLVETVAENLEDRLYYTRVGDPFVIDQAVKKEVTLAGEPNGHYAFPDFVPYNSGILAGLVLSSLDLDPLLDNFPEFSVEKKSVRTGEKDEKMNHLTEQLDPSSIVSEVDGVKFERGDATVLVRPSGTSPKIRVKADSSSPEKTDHAVKWTENSLRNG